MIFRISGKLGKKIHLQPDERLPLDPNRYADWSAHLFTANRVQYILVTNTASLYSVVMFGRGVTDIDPFLRRTFSELRDLLEDDGFKFIAERHVFGTPSGITFSKALNRNVVGSMNELVAEAKFLLNEEDMSPYHVSVRLNEIPLSYLDYRHPKETFRGLRPVRP